MFRLVPLPPLVPDQMPMIDPNPQRPIEAPSITDAGDTMSLPSESRDISAVDGDSSPSVLQAAEHIISVGLGGAGGMAVGAVIGAVAGPAGIAAGAIAGAVAGGLAGEAVAESIDDVFDHGAEIKRGPGQSPSITRHDRESRLPPEKE